MKKREITNNNLEQLFSNIIEQAPLLTEVQVNSLLNNLPKPNSGSTVKRFFQYHLNTLLLSATVVLIIAVTLIWINSDHQSEKTIVQNNPGKNLVASDSTDSVKTEPVNFTDKEISRTSAGKDTVIKESTSKTGNVVVQEETSISLSDIYKYFDKRPQVFTIQANRDTTVICEEGTTIKIKANSFVSEKNENKTSGTLKIAVKEYYKISDIILSNLTTTSSDKILETGGMIHITASADNENYIIKPGCDIEIGFPYSNKKDDMALFYGEQTINIIDWKPAKKEDDVTISVADTESGLKSEVFLIVEEMPEFPGGELALQNYLRQNAQYPYSMINDRIEGKVYVTFVVDSYGNTCNIRVDRGLDKTLDKVAVFVVSNMPKWKPGRQRGMPVNVSYTIPVTFSVKNEELTPEEINQSKELEEQLKDFKFDIEAINFYSNNKQFKELEKNIKDENFQKTTVSEVNQYVFSVTQLGWINCDRFSKNNNQLIDFFIQTDNPEKTIVNAIFCRFKALIPGKTQSGKIFFNNIPFGEKVIVVALKTVNNKILLAVKETEITNNGEVVLDFQPVTVELLKKEMEKLNKYY